MGRDRYRNGWNASSKLARKFESICNEERKRNERRDKRGAFIIVLGKTFSEFKKNTMTKDFASANTN